MLPYAHRIGWLFPLNTGLCVLLAMTSPIGAQTQAQTQAQLRCEVRCN